MAAAAFVVAAVTGAGPAFATDVSYSLRSPNFGGTNSAPLQYEQLQNTQKATTRAAQAQAARAAISAAAGGGSTTNTQAQAFADAIVAQLNAMVSRQIALKIAGSVPGDAGTITANGVSLTYINVDGQLSVTITTPNGVSTISLPTGN